jgi:signal peptidase I
MAMEANSFLPEHYIARAVGLPGETVEIINGQVFIDHKKLESFYSKATVRGMGEEEYFEKMDPSTIENEESMRSYFATNMKSVKVEENTVFVLVDQWWRGTDSRDFGVLPIDMIKGKVLGYKK